MITKERLIFIREQNHYDITTDEELEKICTLALLSLDESEEVDQNEITDSMMLDWLIKNEGIGQTGYVFSSGYSSAGIPKTPRESIAAAMKETKS